MKSIVITGVSSGIGLQCCKIFAENDYRVFGSVRSENDAVKIKAAVGNNFSPLILDVTNSERINKAVEYVNQATNGSNLSGLINNSGIAVSGPLMHLPLNDLQDQFNVNVFGLLSVTKAFLPLLGARKNSNTDNPGKIINISSVSGKIGYPFVGPYAASKHAVEALSHSLRRELLIYGIDVIIIGPGSVTTPIWQKKPVADVDQKYQNTEFAPYLKKIKTDLENSKKQNLKAEFVANRIFKIFHKKHPKARYPIYSSKMQGWLINHILSDRMLDYIIKKKLY